MSRQHTLNPTWSDGSNTDDEVQKFQKMLNTVDYEYKTPWSTEAELAHTNRNKAANYQYKSLWDPPEISKQQKAAIQGYQYKPPYDCEQNVNQQQRSYPYDPNGSSIPPWKSNDLQTPIMKRNYPQKKTSLWGDTTTTGSSSVSPTHSNQATNNADTEADGDPIVNNLRQQLLKHGASGILGLSRKFRIIDDDNSGSLSMDEFIKAMKECEVVDLSTRAMQHLFSYFDEDDSGTISYDEFLIGIRGQMNARRLSIVQTAFKKLDSNHSGTIEIHEMEVLYNTKFHPDYISGKKTEKQLIQDFLNNFKVSPRQQQVQQSQAIGGRRNYNHRTTTSTYNNNNNNTMNNSRNQNNIQSTNNSNNNSSSSTDMVSYRDFERYYANISASIDNDDYFELMIRNAWHLSGGEGWCANTSNTRILVIDPVTGEERVIEQDRNNNPRYNTTNTTTTNSNNNNTNNNSNSNFYRNDYKNDTYNNNNNTTTTTTNRYNASTTLSNGGRRPATATTSYSLSNQIRR